MNETRIQNGTVSGVVRREHQMQFGEMLGYGETLVGYITKRIKNIPHEVSEECMRMRLCSSCQALERSETGRTSGRDG